MVDVIANWDANDLILQGSLMGDILFLLLYKSDALVWCVLCPLGTLGCWFQRASVTLPGQGARQWDSLEMSHCVKWISFGLCSQWFLPAPAWSFLAGGLSLSALQSLASISLEPVDSLALEKVSPLKGSFFGIKPSHQTQHCFQLVFEEAIVRISAVYLALYC